jgi:hypothetical protein
LPPSVWPSWTATRRSGIPSSTCIHHAARWRNS